MNPPTHHDSVRALHWTGSTLRVLDQRRLPAELTYDDCTSAEAVAEAIASMRVRGAPAIGIAAAYGAVLSARRRLTETPDTWQQGFAADLSLLAAARPTAVNLFWALNRMRQVAEAVADDVAARLLNEAEAIHADDIAANHTMGRAGAELITGSHGVLTHCNTGSLATGGFGTALGVIRTIWETERPEIFANETRPWLQGARLTVWELDQDRIPATLIADSAAAWLMRSGKVQWVIVGADRIASNGDTANKIGTYSLAVNAKHHGVRFMVVAPTSTIDWSIADGSRIEIEERNPTELLGNYYDGPDHLIGAWNPVFDVTPAELIDAIVTERGVVLNPTRERMQALLPAATI